MSTSFKVGFMVNRYYICDQCDFCFVIQQRMQDALKKKCPECGKISLYQDLTGQHFHIVGEPSTVGQLAERNNKKMGKDTVEEKQQQHKRDRKRAKDEFANRMGYKPKVADSKTWYNPMGEDLTKKLGDKNSAEKIHKYIMEGE